MKKLIAISLLALSLPVSAIDNDKQKHFIVEAVLCSGVQIYTETWWKTMLTGVAVGTFKEVYDSQQPGNKFSKGDMAANLLGCGAGIGYGNTVLYFGKDSVNIRGKF